MSPRKTQPPDPAPLLRALTKGDQPITFPLEIPDRPRVLVVDDDAGVAHKVLAVLDPKYQARSTTSISQALDWLSEGPVEVLITSAMMKEMKGAEFIRRAKRIRPMLLAIVLTSHGHRDATLEALKVGAFDFLEQPVQPGDILATVDRAWFGLRANLENHRLVLELRRTGEEIIRLNKDLEQRVESRTAQLQAANRELEQFSYVVAHDLKAPLRAIHNYAELVVTRYRERMDAKGAGFLDRMSTAARRMQDMIDNLLAYAQAGTDLDQAEPVDLNQVMQAVRRDVEEELATTQGEVSWGELPRVQGTRTHMMQVFQNLIQNSLKFHGAQPPRIHVSALKGREDWVFSVLDNGIGIPSDQAHRVFQIFRRLHGRDEYPGNGVGLAIVQKIVERLGGRIWVEPRSEAGADIRLTLPAAAE